MCAAPGGKSIILAFQLWQTVGLPPTPHSGVDISQVQCSSNPHIVNSAPSTLCANEPDDQRRARLEAVLKEYLPMRCRNSVKVTGRRAETFWLRAEESTYDRVLLDVPCSSDRHVVQQALSSGAIAKTDWSVDICRQLSSLQLQLLMAGLKTLKPGGKLVYSTCSLAPLENDDVVSNALSRAASTMKRSCIQVIKPGEPEYGMDDATLALFGAEPTTHGVLVLPDNVGTGPMYVAVLTKQQVEVNESDGDDRDEEGEEDCEIDDDGCACEVDGGVQGDGADIGRLDLNNEK